MNKNEKQKTFNKIMKTIFFFPQTLTKYLTIKSMTSIKSMKSMNGQLMNELN